MFFSLINFGVSIPPNAKQRLQIVSLKPPTSKEMGFQAENKHHCLSLGFFLYKAFNIAQTLLMPCVLLMSIVFTETGYLPAFRYTMYRTHLWQDRFRNPLSILLVLSETPTGHI